MNFSSVNGEKSAGFENMADESAAVTGLFFVIHCAATLNVPLAFCFTPNFYF